jgi:hypothetical protein
MPTALELAARDILEAAASSATGIRCRILTPVGIDSVTPTLRAKQVLYRFRRELGDPRYAQIQIRLSPDDPDNELWLIRTGDTSAADI